MLLPPELQDRKVSGKIDERELEPVLEQFAWMLKTRYYRDGDTIYYGQSPPKQLRAYPSYGLKPHEATQIFREQAGLVADKVVVEADQARHSQIQTIVQELAQRKNLTLEIVMLDVSSNAVDRVNAWLDQFHAAIGYYRNTLYPEAALQAGMQMVRRQGFYQDIDIRGLLDLLNVGGNVRVETRGFMQVLSGEQSTFTSGAVLTEQTFTVVPNTSQQLASTISRRTVGLQLNVRAVASGPEWHLGIDVQDSQLNGVLETTTSFRGDRVIQDNEGWFLLCSLTRRAQQQNIQKVPILGSLPGLKRVFTKRQKHDEHRQLMILARRASARPWADPLPQ